MGRGSERDGALSWEVGQDPRRTRWLQACGVGAGKTASSLAGSFSCPEIR